MNVLRSVVMAFQMFSRIPMPQVRWQKENMQFVFAAFPLLGLVLGALLWLWSYISGYLGIGAVLLAVGLTLIPVLFTGAIHLDGLCDTMDALASHGDADKKRAILKDPHTGAFAVIGLSVYLLTYFGLSTEVQLESKALYFLMLIPVLSRSIAGLASLSFPLSSSTGLQSTFHEAAKKKLVLFLLSLWLLLTVIIMFLIQPLMMLALMISAALTTLYVYFMSMKQFGGMSGDLTGYLIQLSELILLAVLIILQRWIIL